MYLSRIVINAELRETMAALAMPNRMHGAVESCFQGERGRNLWRIDWLQGKCCLLIVSKQKPDMSKLAAQYGAPDCGETRPYEALLDKLENEQVWQFRLCANPVHSISPEGKSDSLRGKVTAHVTPEWQRKWLYDRAEKLGFALNEGGFDVVHSQWYRFKNEREPLHEVSLLKVTFEGVLRITDTERFRETLVAGIGREKAYGCGMLTVAGGGARG